MLKEINRMTGTVKWYNKSKGFGFITIDKNGEEVFLHRSALEMNEDMNVVQGDRISFTILDQKKGPAAYEIKHVVEKKELILSKEKELTISEVKKVPISEDKEPSQSDKLGTSIKFTDLNLNPEILHAIKDAGYVDPTPIQAQAIPIVLSGKDLLGCAQTGTGKTAAFALPILEILSRISGKHVLSNENQKKSKPKIKVLVLSPTRELAIQINDSFKIYGYYTGFKSTVVYGGVGQAPQVRDLQRGVDILVATPGRLLDLIRQRHISLANIKVFVLDEGDRMLDMGFIHDMRTIIKLMPAKNRQTLLFSATIPREVIQLAKNMLQNPIKINISPDQPTLEIIKQAAYFISKEKKQRLLEYLLSDSKVKKALVFTRTKHGANRVVKNLHKKKIKAEAIHGNKSQTARQSALKNFRTDKTRVLVATDVASRGIDVDNISHVIQFDLPDVSETYLHRIGRTARAGAGGTALAFCEHTQRKDLKAIEKYIQMNVKIVKNHPFN